MDLAENYCKNRAVFWVFRRYLKNVKLAVFGPILLDFSSFSANFEGFFGKSRKMLKFGHPVTWGLIWEF